MCYNADVSIGTFLFVAAVAGYLWIRNRGLDKPLALILLVVALMQLLEWGLWTNLSCGLVNKLITAIIPLYLVLQPVAINWIVHTYGAGWAAASTGLSYATAAVIAAALMVPYQLYKGAKTYGECASRSGGTDGHLVWKGVPLDSGIAPLYYAAMTYPLATLKNPTFSILYLFFAGLSHWKLKAASATTWPSLWCHFVNLLAVFAVVRPGD